MTQYRLYYQTETLERIRGFEPIEAEDDAQAVSSAEARQRVLGIELWCANRRVKRWELIPADAAAETNSSTVIEANPQF